MGKWIRFASGVVAGAVLYGGLTATARAVSGVMAEGVTQQVCVDGRQVELFAYEIEGSNYVKLRDIGELLDFNVYWEKGIFIDTASPYTGEPPEELVQAIQTPLAAVPVEIEADIEAIRQEIVDLTNELRKEHGLPALELDSKLAEAAQVRADEMAASSVYSHTRPDGRRRTTVTDCPYTAENIHCITVQRMKDPNEELAKIAVDDWAASRTHLDGMLDKNCSGIGVGIARGVNPSTGQDSWYCVQWFLRTGYSISWVDEPAVKK